jgi:hypothetical protein
MDLTTKRGSRDFAVLLEPEVDPRSQVTLSMANQPVPFDIRETDSLTRQFPGAPCRLGRVDSAETGPYN